MANKKSTIILIASAALVIIGAAVLYNALSKPIAPNEATSEPSADVAAAPDFTMLDTEGNTVALAEYIGTPIVLNFWVSWCGPCQQEMPVFDALAAELGDSIHFLMINLTDGSRETIEGVSEFISDNGYTFPVYYDTENKGATAYAVRSIPVTYFIDAEGSIQAYHVGAMNENSIRQGIERISS